MQMCRQHHYAVKFKRMPVSYVANHLTQSFDATNDPIVTTTSQPIDREENRAAGIPGASVVRRDDGIATDNVRHNKNCAPTRAADGNFLLCVDHAVEFFGLDKALRKYDGQ